MLVMDRVWNSRGRTGSGFGRSGSGRVLAHLKVGFGFYTAGFRVFVGFLIYARMGQIRVEY